MKKLETTKDLAQFTATKVKRSSLSIEQIAKKLGISTISVDHGISKGQSSNSGRNGVRRKILALLGYDVTQPFIVKKRTKRVE